MDKEHRVSVYDMVKELNLKEVTPEINSKEVYIEQAEINRPALQFVLEPDSLRKRVRVRFLFIGGSAEWVVSTP